jgi:uncharacterized protein (TIGR03437 family)
MQYVVALFPDGVTYVLPTGAIPDVQSRPAKAGDTITLYGIGFGPTTPSTSAGQVTPASNSLALPVKITLSYGEFNTPLQATTTYTGLAPGIVGLYQFNVVIPQLPSSAGNTWTIAFELGGIPSLSATLALSLQ